MDALLPRVPYRQWVLVLPKRLRYFVHRNPALAGEVSRILASAINRFYAERSGCGGETFVPCAPAQVLVVQRFGAKANLHVHLHAVVSDGVFALRDGLGVTGKLQFIPAPEPSPAEIADLCERLRPKRRTRRREEVVAASSRNHAGPSCAAWSGSARFPRNPSGRCSHDRMEDSRLTQACAWRRTTGRPWSASSAIACGAEMKPVAAITRDCELERLLRNLGLPTDFPKTKPARSPPQATDDSTQVDPRVELWEGVDDRAGVPAERVCEEMVGARQSGNHEGPQPDWAAA